MSWYRTGTVTVTNGSTTVTGSGTAWVANSRVGDAFVGPDGLTYEITNIASNTAISILPAYRSASGSGQSYSIIPVQGYTKTLADQASDLVNSYDKPWNVADDAADARSALGIGTAGTLDREVFDHGVGSTIQTKVYSANIGLGGSLTWQLRDPVNDALVTSSMFGYIYRVRIVTLLTGTSTGYVGVAYNHPVNGWKVHKTSSAADPFEGSNHPYLFIDTDGSPKVKMTHVNTYNVLIFVERIYASNNYAAKYIFGTDSYIGVNGNDLTFELTSGTPVSILSGVNTTVDSNGFIKQASPIVKLFSDKVDLNSESGKQRISLIVNGIGDYSIVETTGFAQDGWYIETPKDSNGNIKCFVEYEQIAQSDGTYNINVKTFEPDYSEGPAKAGVPKHIPEGRWIDIRLQPLPASEQGDQVGNDGEN